MTPQVTHATAGERETVEGGPADQNDERWRQWIGRGAAHDRAVHRPVAPGGRDSVERMVLSHASTMTRPPHIGAFEFVVLASLRTAQLIRGCAPKMPTTHKHVVTAQCEVAAGLVTNAVLQKSDGLVSSRPTTSDLPEHTGRSQDPMTGPARDRLSAPPLTSIRPEPAPLI
jgi:DNA-directed RNA polymerase subunit K/omega